MIKNACFCCTGIFSALKQHRGDVSRQAGLIQRATNKVICFCCGARAIRASMPAALLHDPDAWIMPRSRHSLLRGTACYFSVLANP